MAFAGGGTEPTLARRRGPGSPLLPVRRAVRGADVLRPARRLERARPLRRCRRPPIRCRSRSVRPARSGTATSELLRTRDDAARRERRTAARASRQLVARDHAHRGARAGERPAARPRSGPAAAGRSARSSPMWSAPIWAGCASDWSSTRATATACSARRPSSTPHGLRRPDGARRPVERRGHADHRSRACGARWRSCATACARSPSARATTTNSQLPYLPVNSDVKVGDLLVTSGLGGVFPAGVPVGIVTRVRARSGPDPRAGARTPRATLARDRQVMLLWFDPSHPAAPVESDADATNAPAPPAPACRRRCDRRRGRPARPPAGRRHELRRPARIRRLLVYITALIALMLHGAAAAAAARRWSGRSSSCSSSSTGRR